MTSALIIIWWAFMINIHFEYFSLFKNCMLICIRMWEVLGSLSNDDDNAKDDA